MLLPSSFIIAPIRKNATFHICMQLKLIKFNFYWTWFKGLLAHYTEKKQTNLNIDLIKSYCFGPVIIGDQT